MEKKESADAQKHNLDFVCIKYDFIPHPIHKTNQIYQTIKQSNFDSVFAHYLICCHIPHTHISLLIKNDAWRIGSMLDEMYNQGKPEHRKIVWYIYIYIYIYNSPLLTQCIKKLFSTILGLKLLTFILNSDPLLQHLQGYVLLF